MGGSNKERKSRGGHGLFNWDQIRDDRWKGVYLGSSVHGISSRYAKVKDLEWYKKVDGKMMAGDAQNELEEIKKREEEAFAQALGYSAPAIVNKSIPKISHDELKKVIIDESQDNYNDQQGGLGYSNASLRDYKDSIKDHLPIPSEPGSLSRRDRDESRREDTRRDARKREERRTNRDKSPQPKHKRSHSRDNYDRKDKYSRRRRDS